MADEGERAFGSEGPERPIVVGYDGKDHSRDALLWAAAEAARRDAPLLVVHAANYPGMKPHPGPGALEPEPGALAADQEVTVRGVSEALHAYPDLRIAGATEVTSPSEALIEASRAAELVVIGTRGHGRVVGALLGSVALAAPAQARCPVIVVKREPANRRVHEDRIVVGTDGSPPAAAAVAFAAERAATTAVPLDVVICTGIQAAADWEAQQLRAVAESVAGSTTAWLRDTWPAVAVTVRVEDGPADRVLVDASTAAELVVVGTRGRGALKGLLLGSVSQGVISGARCPVAVVGEDHEA
jgi:nucleotide-binding universal stress UspA family protein